MSTDYLHTPERACPVLEAMRRGLTDALPYRRLQELQALPPAPSGTADDGLAEVRAFMALDWLIRVYLPGFLELSPPCREHAERIRKLDRIVDLPSAERAGPVMQQARTAALDAADAAREAAAVDAARAVAAAADDAVDDAVMRAVMRAVTRAVTDAAWAASSASAAAWAASASAAAAVSAAAWTTAETARLAAVSGAVRAAVRAAAAAAAVTAAPDAARGVPEDAVRQAAVLAAWDVARTALVPTVESLQDSAIALYADMVDVRLRGAVAS